MDKSKVYTRTFSGITMQVDSETIDFLQGLEEDEKDLKRYINYVYGIAFKGIKSQIDENGHYAITNNDSLHMRIAIIQHCLAVLNGYEDSFQKLIAKETKEEKD